MYWVTQNHTMLITGYKINIHLGFILLRVFLSLVKNISWKVFYVFTYLIGSEQNTHHSKMAHVQTILLRHRFDRFGQMAGENDFITIHHSYQDPAYVLQDHVFFYNITKTKALFVEVDKGKDVRKEEFFSFLNESLFHHAKYLITLPLNEFHSLAGRLQPPKHLVFIGLTARCGSTLLTNLFREIPNGVGLNEPPVISALLDAKDYLMRSEYIDFIKHTVNFLCKKPYKATTNDDKVYAIKIWIAMNANIPDLKIAFPQAKFIFIYREGLPVVRSFMLMQTCTFQPISYIVPPFIGCRFPDDLFNFLPSRLIKTLLVGNFRQNRKQLNVYGLVAFFYYFWAYSIKTYNNLVSNNFPISAVKYEHLVKDPHRICRLVFEYLDLEFDEDSVNRIFGKHSQRNSSISKDKMSVFKRMDVTKEERQVCDGISQFFGLPTTDQTYVAPNTLC